MPSTTSHLINTRTLTTFNTINEELALEASKNYLFDLSHLAVLDVTGAKACDFLQGQLTCDVHLVSNTTMIQGAQCNLKGRILSLLDIVEWNGLKLVLPEDLAESVQHSLTKTALLSRVAIQQNTSLKAFGFALQNPKDALPMNASLPTKPLSIVSESSYCVYSLGQGFYLFLIDKAIETSFCEPFIQKKTYLGSLTWHSLMLGINQFSIYPESRGYFLPHRVGLHETSALSFNKGCYKGQEIIARMHYKSTVKHELRGFKLKTKEALFSGQKVFKSDEEVELGEVVDYSYLGDEDYLVLISLLKGAKHHVLFENHTNALELIPNTVNQ